MQKGIYNKFWTIEDVAIIRCLYPNFTNAFIANFLGKTEHSIIAKAFKLKLIKDPEFIYQCAIKSPALFKPGQKPHNTGKKMVEWMSPESIEQSKQTRFKKGEEHVSYGKSTGKLTFYAGSVYINAGYKRREIYARYQYKKFIGELKRNDIVTFKDGNPRNCCPTNLVLISRAENMHRNSGVYNLPDGLIATYLAVKSRVINHELREELLKYPDLIELKRNQLLLNREIKKHGKS